MNKIVLNITRCGFCLQRLCMPGLGQEGQCWATEAGEGHQGEDVMFGENELTASTGVAGLSHLDTDLCTLSREVYKYTSIYSLLPIFSETDNLLQCPHCPAQWG